VLLPQGQAIWQTTLSMLSRPPSFTWQALILLPMHEANTCRFITHVCDLNWHHFSLSRLNQSLHSVLLCPRTSYLTNYSQHVSLPTSFTWQALTLLPMHEANTVSAASMSSGNHVHQHSHNNILRAFSVRRDDLHFYLAQGLCTWFSTSKDSSHLP